MKTSSEQNRRILVIDDEQRILDDFKKILCPDELSEEALDQAAEALFGNQMASLSSQSTQPFHINTASQGEDGYELVKKAVEELRPYAVAFVDMRMPPGWDGLETVERIWSVDDKIQIVICTAYSDYSWKDFQKRVGMTDRFLILKKPFDNLEVCQLASTLVYKWNVTRQSEYKRSELEVMVDDRTRDLARTNEHLQREISIRKRAEEQLMYAATHDMLTGLFNRRYLIDQLMSAVRLAKRYEHALSLCLCDLDDFKAINDSHGHRTGDEVLAKFGKMLNNGLRNTDICGRYGGDEFCIVFPHISAQEAAITVERIRTCLESLTFQGRDGTSFKVTATFGIAELLSSTMNENDLLETADEVMYRAKHAGRNCVMINESPQD